MDYLAIVMNNQTLDAAVIVLRVDQIHWSKDYWRNLLWNPTFLVGANTP